MENDALEKRGGNEARNAYEAATLKHIEIHLVLSRNKCTEFEPNSDTSDLYKHSSDALFLLT